MDAGPDVGMAVAVSVVVGVACHLGSRGGIEEEVGVESLEAVHGHEQTTSQQHGGNTEGAQALDLAEARGEPVGGWP
jgi:hypothetical protein